MKKIILYPNDVFVSKEYLDTVWWNMCLYEIVSVAWPVCEIEPACLARLH